MSSPRAGSRPRETRRPQAWSHRVDGSDRRGAACPRNCLAPGTGRPSICSVAPAGPWFYTTRGPLTIATLTGGPLTIATLTSGPLTRALTSSPDHPGAPNPAGPGGQGDPARVPSIPLYLDPCPFPEAPESRLRASPPGFFLHPSWLSGRVCRDDPSGHLLLFSLRSCPP